MEKKGRCLVVTSNEKGYDPIFLSEEMEKRVVRGLERKYVRFRATRFYGGIATGDVVGCNLRCIFCWAGRIREDPTLGFWVSPEKAYSILKRIARSKGFNAIRLSAGEPTIGFDHLTKLLDLVDEEGDFLFILETNGILLGARREYAARLAKYTSLHVRVSVKACNEDWFHRLTLAKPSSFEYQLRAVRNLLDHGVSFHIAIVASFGEEECWASFFARLAEIDEALVSNMEVEVIKLYPHVVKALKKHGIWPRTAYRV